MAENGEKTNGWNEWSKHVLKELERLNTNYESLHDKIDSIKEDVGEEISTLKNDITKVKAMTYSLDDMKAWKKQYEEEAVLKTVKELKKWKSDVDEVSSPTQLKENIKDLNNLKTFRTQAVTVFLVAQALVAIACALLKFYD